MYLVRYHDVTISVSGVWRILHRLGHGPTARLAALPTPRPPLEALREATPRPPGPDRRQVRRTPTRRGLRQERQAQPGRAQADSEADRAAREFYQFTAIDDCTRLRIMKIYPKVNQKTAIQFVDYVLAQLSFAVEAIQTGNGSDFASMFHWHVLDKGIRHVYIKPRTPRLNGKVERSHRIDAEEFYRLLDGVVIDDINIFNARLKE
jgi:hypothetical protein